MRVTLRDIAERAGVSTMTVSNVINGNRARVSPTTIARVQKIAAELGYVPSASARSLATSSSRLIGLLVPAADSDSLMLSPHNVAIIGQIERELRKCGYHMLLRGIARTEEMTEALQSWSLDGAILMGFFDEEIDLVDSSTAAGVRVLAIDSYSPNPLAIGARSDDFDGASLAASHLLRLGHRHIVFAGPHFSEIGVVRERFDGFRHALRAAGIEWETTLLEHVETASHTNGVALGQQLRTRHPHATAVFATADILAIGIVAGLTSAGFGVPSDVSVVGFDDLDLCLYVTPQLTTISQDISQKAATAVQMLIASIEAPDQPRAPVTLAVHLVERESTGPARVVIGPPSR